MNADRAGHPRAPLMALFAADAISTLGTRMSALAVPWFVLTTTGSATAAGFAATAELLPYVVAQALGGPAIDRVGAWRTSVAANAAAALGIGAAPLLWATHALPFGVLCGVLAAVGVLRGLADTAGYVLVPGLVDRAGTPMARATGAHDGVRRTAQLIGAPLAGALVAWVSAPAVLVVDAVTFAAAAAIVLTAVPRGAQPEPVTSSGPDLEHSPAPGERARRTYVAQLAEGLRFLRADRLLLGIAALVTVTNLLDQAWTSVLAPVWARDVAGSPVALGLIATAFGLGAVTGNVAAAWLGPRLPRRLAFGVGFLVCGAPRFVAVAVASSVSPVLAVMVVAGLGAGVINPVVGAVEFERVPRPFQARVLGTLNALAWLGMPFGGLLAGVAVDGLGLRAALWVAGGLYLAVTLAPFVFPVWREFDAPAPDPASAAVAASSSGGRGTTPAG